MNRAELEGYIAEVYSTQGESPWAQSPTNTVFRHATTGSGLPLSWTFPEKSWVFPVMALFLW